MLHQYTIEILYHFTCNFCHAWWNYAFTPTHQLHDYNLMLPDDEAFWCPHCGSQGNLKIKDGFPLLDK